MPSAKMTVSIFNDFTQSTVENQGTASAVLGQSWLRGLHGQLAAGGGDIVALRIAAGIDYPRTEKDTAKLFDSPFLRTLQPQAGHGIIRNEIHGALLSMEQMR